jgi:hypothetical protein
LLAVEDYRDLVPEQRAAYLVFWYESEVQNGGHLQHLENRGTVLLAATIKALGLLGAGCHQQLLREPGDVWLSRERQRIQIVEEYGKTGLEGELDTFDSRFHACSPTLQNCLEAHLKRHQSSFVIVA